LCPCKHKADFVNIALTVNLGLEIHVKSSKPSVLQTVLFKTQQYTKALVWEDHLSVFPQEYPSEKVNLTQAPVDVC
jgi:hypothetical protein